MKYKHTAGFLIIIIIIKFTSYPCMDIRYITFEKKLKNPKKIQYIYILLKFFLNDTADKK